MDISAKVKGIKYKYFIIFCGIRPQPLNRLGMNAIKQSLFRDKSALWLLVHIANVIAGLMVTALLLPLRDV